MSGIQTLKTLVVSLSDIVIGCVAPSALREEWLAYSIHRKSAAEENTARFPNMHAAIDWLQEEHDRHIARQAELA